MSHGTNYEMLCPSSLRLLKVATLYFFFSNTLCNNPCLRKSKVPKSWNFKIEPHCSLLHRDGAKTSYSRPSRLNENHNHSRLGTLGAHWLTLLSHLNMPMQGGGVPPTVHILVHLLGDLLRVAEVRRRHSHPESQPASTTVRQTTRWDKLLSKSCCNVEKCPFFFNEFRWQCQ